jgi:hypothetical protein
MHFAVDGPSVAAVTRSLDWRYPLSQQSTGSIANLPPGTTQLCVLENANTSLHRPHIPDEAS